MQWWRITFLLAMAALLGAAPTQAPEPPSDPVRTLEMVPAVALSHRARHLMDALEKGDPQAVKAAQLEVEALRRSYYQLDVTPLVEALSFWARQQGFVGKEALGLEGIQAVERWAPNQPTLLGTRILLMRQQGIQGWLWSFPELLRLTQLRLEHPAHRWLWLVQHLGLLRLTATLLLWGWALTMGLRYRNVLRNLWEEPLIARNLAPILTALVGMLVLAGPVILGLDPLVAAMVWLILMAPFLLADEVKVTTFLLLLQLVHPALVAMEPWAVREPQPSLMPLQLQPQIRPVPPEMLRRLPPADQAFLKGWSQLRNEDWKAAETSFQGLVGRHPEQAEVLNNLGVARFQLGDVDGANKAFEKALAGGGRMEVFLNQSIMAFSRLDTALGSAKRDDAQAAAPDAYARLIALNDARKDERTYPIPLPDTPQRVQALADAMGDRSGATTFRFTEPTFLAALLLPLLGCICFLLSRFRASLRMERSTQCLRCGDAFLTAGSADTEICPKCDHLFVLRDGLHAENRLRKLDEVAEYQQLTRWIHKCLIVLLPGCDLAFLGQAREGVIEFLPFCLAVSMVLATGRAVRYPGEILADPISTWLVVGEVLVGVCFLRSWLKLILRRA